MFDCMVNFIASQWGWVLLWVIICMVVGFFAGGWWGVLVGFGIGALSIIIFAAINCSRR